MRADDDDSTQAPDQVLDQDPEAKAAVREGRTVTLTVSSATVTMPDIVGKTRERPRARWR